MNGAKCCLFPMHYLMFSLVKIQEDEPKANLSSFFVSPPMKRKRWFFLGHLSWHFQNQFVISGTTSDNCKDSQYATSPVCLLFTTNAKIHPKNNETSKHKMKSIASYSSTNEKPKDDLGGFEAQWIWVVVVLTTRCGWTVMQLDLSQWQLQISNSNTNSALTGKSHLFSCFFLDWPCCLLLNWRQQATTMVPLYCRSVSNETLQKNDWIGATPMKIDLVWCC